jgi:hypothetical protein
MMFVSLTNMLNKYFDKILIATAGGVSASTLTYILMDCQKQQQKRQISEAHKKEIEQIKKSMF